MKRSPAPSHSIGNQLLRPAAMASGVILLLVWLAWVPPAPSAAEAAHKVPALDTVTAPAAERIAADELLVSLSVLAHDSMEGRRTGTEGNERAQRYLLERFDGLGLAPVAGQRTQAFGFVGRRDQQEHEGLNIMGKVEGTTHPDRYVVITAHYDHLGVRDDQIFNGADDNASGTAALLVLADYFLEHPPASTLIFVAMDAEEMGLQGARAFVTDPPVPLEQVVMNVNLDMISRSDVDELYAAGTYHSPFLTPLVEEVADGAPVNLLMGHDSPDLPPGDDWTMASDHGPFHEAGVPFIYFGVEDHPGYHHPSDTFENITPEFYVNAVETVLDFLLVVDREAETILEARPQPASTRL